MLPFPGPAQGSPHALVPQRDDTALFQDARLGFSHLLPGRPVLVAPSGEPGEPPADAVIHLQDAPITIRYRVEAPSFAARSAGELARVMGEQYAAWRTGAQPPADPANPTWLATWGVDAASVAAYEVPGDRREDLFVLVRQHGVLLVTWTYPRALVDDPTYAMFASVAEATMVWDPARWMQTGRVWPHGAFLTPGLVGVPHPKVLEQAKALAGAHLLPEERSRLFAILSGIVCGAGAPWVPLARDVHDTNRRALLAVVKNVRVRAFIEEAFADVHTAHDLRGLAIVLARGLEPADARPRAPSAHDDVFAHSPKQMAVRSHDEMLST
ncbi:MAG: hypothetical protein JST00_24660 [Deltaproteobacteria bacterium]|nr:hypothetical protein [Deltaproteobacteria bacterium]